MDAEPGLFQAVRDLGARTTISLPLLRDGKPIGAISLNSPEPGGFSDSQLELLHAFAEQAVIAITGAANFRALGARTAELTRSVAELQTLEEVLRAAVDEGVPAPVLSAALFGRFSSRGEADFANRVLSAMRHDFGGHAEKPPAPSGSQQG